MSDRILIVDDEPEVLEGYGRILHAEFDVHTALGGELGLVSLHRNGPFAVVIADMRMPGMDGAQFLARVRSEAPDTVRMLLTGCRELEIAIKAVNEGNIFRFLTKPCPKDILSEAIHIGVIQYRLVTKTRAQQEWETLTALARAIDAKSTWTAGHSERVTQWALGIARAMGLSQDDLRIIHRGGLLHDIGKIGTPPAILDKAARLDPVETVKMRDHVQVGIRILEPITAFREVIPIVAQHHEWFDGSGYPAHLAGEGISLHGRIVAVADTFDAITSDRPYRKGLPPERALLIIRENSGTQFDPQVIDALARFLAERDAASVPATQDRAQSASGGQS